MKRALSALGALVFLALSGTWLYSAVPLPPSPSCAEASQLFACLSQMVSNINSPGPTGVNPNTMATYSNFRNLLDNGAMQVTQRGTAERTCAQAASASTVAAYGADRWTCQANVTSGAGFSSIGTATPTPPSGFLNETKLYRKTGALTQPVCMLQEVESNNSYQLQGQTVTLSAYVQPLTISVANTGAGQPITLYVYTGTSTDEGFGTQGSANAIPPAWTGIATAVSTTFTASSTATWTRISTQAVIPTAATEVGVAICYTPSASGTAGTTDGIAITGAQLEVGSTPSAFEFRPYSVEQQKAQRFFWQLSDNQANTFKIALCQATTTSVALCDITPPVTMRVAPTVAVATATSFGVTVAAGTAGTCTTLATVASANTPNSAWVSCTTGSTLAAGNAAQLIYANSGAANTITATSDF